MLIDVEGKQYFIHFRHDRHVSGPGPRASDTIAWATALDPPQQDWQQTICQIHEGKCQIKKCPDATVKLVAMHVAHCSPEDQFVKAKGRIVSLTHAIRPHFSREARKQIWVTYFNNFPLPGPKTFDYATEFESWRKHLMKQFAQSLSMELIATVAHDVAKRMEERHG